MQPTVELSNMIEQIKGKVIADFLESGLTFSQFDAVLSLHEHLSGAIDDMTTDEIKRLIEGQDINLDELVQGYNEHNVEQDDDLEMEPNLLWHLIMVVLNLEEEIQKLISDDVEEEKVSDDPLDLTVRIMPEDDEEQYPTLFFIPHRDTQFRRYLWDIVFIEPEPEYDTETEDA